MGRACVGTMDQDLTQGECHIIIGSLTLQGLLCKIHLEFHTFSRNQSSTGTHMRKPLLWETGRTKLPCSTTYSSCAGCTEPWSLADAIQVFLRRQQLPFMKTVPPRGLCQPPTTAPSEVKIRRCLRTRSPAGEADLLCSELIPSVHPTIHLIH